MPGDVDAGLDRQLQGPLGGEPKARIGVKGRAAALTDLVELGEQ